LTISNPQFRNKKVGDPMLDQLIPIKNELEKERQRNADLVAENVRASRSDGAADDLFRLH
jgi:hypothetical protein